LPFIHRINHRRSEIRCDQIHQLFFLSKTHSPSFLCICSVSVIFNITAKNQNPEAEPTMEKQQTPSFLKLYTGDSDERLRIPDSFMDQYGQNLSGKIALTSTYGDPVVVSVEMIAGKAGRQCFYFKLGWADFVDENGVQEGDFMVFNFTGDRTANVVVYNSSGCLKGVTVKRQQVGSVSQKKRFWDEDDEETEHASVPKTAKRSKRVKREAPELKKVQPELHSSGNAHGLAKSPSFSVEYKGYNKYFCIPKKFSETLELSVGDKVQLQDPTGEVWSVGVISGGGQAQVVRLSSGWTGFVIANRLGVGDRLEFCYKTLGLIQVKIDRKKKVKIDRRKKKKVMASEVEVEEEEEEEEEGDGLYCERVVMID
ncbi:Putative B3 domain-containing protein Os03g0621600, partial [Linum grandiflorum]